MSVQFDIVSEGFSVDPAFPVPASRFLLVPHLIEYSLGLSLLFTFEKNRVKLILDIGGDALRNYIIVALIGLAIFVVGCSTEPQTGTRVVLVFPAGKTISREELVSTSQYLKSKGQLVLGVHAPRVDKTDTRTLTLLLPGKKISRDQVHRLIESASIELYHLSNVATNKSPDRPWKLRVPSSVKGPYLFLGPNAQRIDSIKDAKLLLADVVGYPAVKPVLTGRDILPTAVAQELKEEWGVQVRFNKNGAKTLRDFTKRNVGEYLAIFYNGRLVSAPLITEPIPSGDARITGFATESIARSAVSDLNAGALPTQLKITRVEYY